MNNLFTSLPSDLSEEVVESLHGAEHVRIERIVSRGHSSPERFWYDQPQDEWVLLLRGAARLQFADSDQLLDLKPGDFINIPAGRTHRVDWTAPNEVTIWLAIHHGAFTRQ